MWNNRQKTSLAKLRNLPARPEWVLRGKNQLLSYMASHPKYSGVADSHSSLYNLLASPVAIAFSVCVLAVVGATGVAAQQALPTDLLYPLKLATERAEVALTFSNSTRAVVRLKHADERLNEAKVLEQRGEAEQIVADTLAMYETEVHGASQLASAVPAASAAGDLQERVRTRLVIQQAELERWREHAAGERLEQKPARNRLAVLKALKVSSEGELVVLPALDINLGEDSAADSESINNEPVAKARARSTKQDPTPAGAAAPSLMAAPLSEAENDDRGNLVDPAALSIGAEAELKLTDAEEKLAAIEVESGNVTEPDDFDKVINRAREALERARESSFEASNSGKLNSQRSAYREALKAYQSVLEAEISAAQGVDSRGGHKKGDGGKD